MIDDRDLAAKSDQMNAVDFVNPITFRIVRVDYNALQDQPVKIHLEGVEGRPYKPCKSMIRGLCQVWGKDQTKWNNRLIELYCDPDVIWAGKKSGGIRISAVSGITEPYDFLISISKTKRAIHTFNPIKDNAPVVKEFILAHHQDKIAKAETIEAVEAIVKGIRAEFGNDAMMQVKSDVLEARNRIEGTTA